jgi:membrane protease subunit (stomatin/prohibitin family)
MIPEVVDVAIIDVIEYPNEASNELVHREPEDTSGEFRLGSQLIVRESQRAVFFRDGKALDVFGAGRHTLSTNNVPLLGALIGLPFGGDSPFKAEVYFVSMREFTDFKWGSAQPLVYRDTELGMVRLRAFGTYSVRVSDPQPVQRPAGRRTHLDPRSPGHDQRSGGCRPGDPCRAVFALWPGTHEFPDQRDHAAG